MSKTKKKYKKNTYKQKRLKNLHPKKLSR